MADALSLHELITALTGAVTQAQDAIQQHQLGAIGRYFNPEGHPLAYTFQLPNPSRDPAKPLHRPVLVPLLSLLEPNLLAISEFTVDFRVALGSLAGLAETVPDRGPVEASAAPVSAPRPAGAPIEVLRVAPRGGPDGAAAAPVDDGSRSDGGHELQAPPAMGISLAGPSDTAGPLANLTIKVVSRPMADGMSRLIDALNKTI
jgi:hypothetical protein